MTRSIRTAAIVLMATLLAGPLASAQTKLDNALQDEMSFGSQELLRVIVRTVPDPDVMKRVEKDVEDLMKNSGMNGGPLVHHMLFAMTARLPRELITVLEVDPDIVSVSADAPIRSQAKSDQQVAIDEEYARLQADREDLLAMLVDAPAAMAQEYANLMAELEAEAQATHQALAQQLAALEQAVAESQVVGAATQAQADAILTAAQALRNQTEAAIEA